MEAGRDCNGQLYPVANSKGRHVRTGDHGHVLENFRLLLLFLRYLLS